MPFSVSPSVTVTEKDLSALIPAASTSIAAFVGRFNWGPVDEVVTISSEKELSEVFGFPDPGERGIDWFIVANYLNYGNAVRVVRIDEGDSVVGGGLTCYHQESISSQLTKSWRIMLWVAVASSRTLAAPMALQRVDPACSGCSF